MYTYFRGLPWVVSILLYTAAVSTGVEPLPRLYSTDAHLAKLLQRGQPVVLLDAMATDWPLAGWSCERFHSEFAQETMRREYDQTDEHAALELGNTQWLIKSFPNGDLAHESGPVNAPWYWPVKEGSENLRSRIYNLSRLAAGLPDTNANRALLAGTAEFWFAPPNGGAKVHADPHCESTVSITISGHKRWRVGPPPPVPRFSERIPLYDGGVDVQQWQPAFEGNVGPGEAILFPPGYLHQTTNVGSDCSASVTYQWQHPVPAQYLRNSLPTLALTEEIMACWPLWEAYSTLLPPARLRQQANAHSLPAVVQTIWDKLNVNHDGHVGREQLAAYLVENKLLDTDQLLEHSMQTDCFLGVQDLDNDGLIQLQELNATAHRFLTLDTVRAHPWLVAQAWTKLEQDCEEAEVDLGVLHPRVPASLPVAIRDAKDSFSPSCRTSLQRYLELSLQQKQLDSLIQ